MIAANTSIRFGSATKLMVLKPGQAPQQRLVEHLPDLLRRGDLVVVNDAGTLPASFSGIHVPSGQVIEMRLASAVSHLQPQSWSAVLFGEGDWKTPTEKRPAPPVVRVGDLLRFGSGLGAVITEVSTEANRLCQISFAQTGDQLWREIYRQGRPIQYSHLKENLHTWDVQSIFSGPPVSVEPPSAAFAFTWKLLFQLQRLGVEIAPVTHAAGISNTGDPAVDSRLPLPEWYSISHRTADAVTLAIQQGRRVIAIGTSVARALESAARPTNGSFATVVAGIGLATLRITPQYQRKVVNAILSGFHEDGASHLQLLASFIDADQMRAAYQIAARAEYRSHEFGDNCLLFG